MRRNEGLVAADPQQGSSSHGDPTGIRLFPGTGTGCHDAEVGYLQVMIRN